MEKKKILIWLVRNNSVLRTEIQAVDEKSFGFVADTWGTTVDLLISGFGAATISNGDLSFVLSSFWLRYTSLFVGLILQWFSWAAQNGVYVMGTEMTQKWSHDFHFGVQIRWAEDKKQKELLFHPLRSVTNTLYFTKRLTCKNKRL